MNFFYGVILATISLFFNVSTESIIRILHLTDIHYDPYFQSESAITSFCHRNSTRIGEEISSFIWGRECDSSIALIEITLKAITAIKNPISVIFLTGDVTRHDHDDEIPVTRDEIIWVNSKVKSLLSYYFPGVPVIFSVGNNDLALHDALSPGPNHDLQMLGQIWMSGFSKDQISSFNHGGYWFVWISEKIKVISLNTLYFSKENFMVEGCDSDSSPGALQLEWLKSELKDARKTGKKVIIIGHIPPLKAFYRKNCLNAFTALIHKFPDVITCLMFGHIHMDDIFILKHKGIPVAAALVSPALSPVFNPSFRVYEVDDQNSTMLDYHQHYAPLKNDRIQFIKEYSCQEAFGNGPLNLEYFINIKMSELKYNKVKIQKNRFRFVGY